VDQNVKFVKIERVGEEESLGAPEVVIYAQALLQIDGPGTAAFPEKQQHAMALLKALPHGRSFVWWVDTVRFPFNPDTTLEPEKRVSDSHGHAHH
jgi:hypothetical protein